MKQSVMERLEHRHVLAVEPWPNGRVHFRAPSRSYTASLTTEDVRELADELHALADFVDDSVE